jgi:hypothetical protein
MARVFPNRPLKGTKSNAERKVFYALKDLLAEDYTVFHSVPVYYRTDENSMLMDGEIDFIVAHSNKGLMLIEVKGGGISCDSTSGEWMTSDSEGQKHRIKNPYEQAKKNKYALIEELRECNLTTKYSFPMGHAVWFPDIELTSSHLGFSAKLEKITLDARDLTNANSAINELFKESLSELSLKPPGYKGIDALVKHLAPHWEIAPTLSAKILGEQQEIIEATKSQFKVLSFLGRVSRALIKGCAGSGKTLLALEKAKRLADDGQSVLVICFNKRLASWLRVLLPGSERIHIFHFHGLCSHMCREANLPLSLPDPLGKSDLFYEQILPESILEALSIRAERFDAVIVDEGQDFRANWWIPIEECLKDPIKGTFYIFYDDNQLIYNREIKFPFEEPKITLLENCRNTKEINEYIRKFYLSDGYPDAIGPEGTKPEVIVSNNEMASLKQILGTLIYKQKVKPEDIVILTPLKMNNSFLKEGTKIGNLSINWNNEIAENRILCSTIHSFKGLESPVVILCELSGLNAKKSKELLYVGVSRAKNHLIFIIDEQHYSESHRIFNEQNLQGERHQSRSLRTMNR